MPRPRLLLPLLVLAFCCGAAAPAYGAPQTVYTAAGDKAAIEPTVTKFEADYPGRHIDWDGQPASDSVPTNAYADQGMLLGSPGATGDFASQGSFDAYSPPNLFETVGSTVTTVDFLVPGTSTPADVRAFGVVFSHATGSTSKLELLDWQGNPFVSQTALPGQLSFVGLALGNTVNRVVRVRITAGTTEGTTVLDDFLYDPPVADGDRDGIPTSADNCPTTSNPGQSNVDKDSTGDACDPDADNDGVPNQQDAFPLDRTESVDTDGDGIGDNKDPDDDNDGLSDVAEGRLGTDPKRPDTDGDGIPDGQDNCPITPNADQADSNGDGRGNACSDTVPPVLSSLKLKPPRFEIGSKNGTRVSFRLSESASVELTVTQLLAGHRKTAGSRCLKGAPTKDKKGRTHELACTFAKPMRGAIQRAASAGTNFAKFTGRIAGRWISPGRYTLTASTTDAAGNVAKKRPSARFTVLP